MPTSACVVIGCDTTYADKVTRRHRFPKDTIRFNIWVQRSGNNNLLNKTVDDVYKSFVMCDKHFEPCYKSFGLNRLNTNAVPTLNLPGMIEMFNVNDESDSVNADCLMNVSTVSSTMNISVNEGMIEIFNVNDVSDSVNADCLMNVSTVSSTMNISVNEGVDQNENTPLLPRILFSMKKNCKSLLKDINIQRRAQLTPRKALLYNSVRVYKHQNLILQKRYSNAKQRIKIADTYINSNANSLNGLNQFTQNFIESQMRMQPQKPRGRRFTVDDIVISCLIVPIM